MTTGWGIGAHGITPWGGGAVAFAVAGAVPIAENAVRISFGSAPYSDGAGSSADALDEEHYAVSALGGVGLDGKPARNVLVAKVLLVPGIPEAIDVVVDRPFSPWPCRYLVSAHGLRSKLTGLPLPAGGTSAAFDGLMRTVENQLVGSAIRRRDVASPQTASDAMDPLPDPIRAVMGSFNPDSTGDYGFDEGVTAYRKRIFRRIYCRKRRFVFLPPTWGLGVQDELKTLNTAEKRMKIAADMEAQIKQEPETAECEVRSLTNPAAPGLVKFHIKAKMKDGRKLEMFLPFSIG